MVEAHILKTEFLQEHRTVRRYSRLTDRDSNHALTAGHEKSHVGIWIRLNNIKRWQAAAANQAFGENLMLFRTVETGF
jgi:hypothetical protein